MLILASTSPRRKELLSLTGWDFETFAIQVDESLLPRETPQDYVARLAMRKAQTTLEMLRQDNHTPLTIIAADTAVVDLDASALEQRLSWEHALAEGRYTILGKPACESEAVQMLLRLRDRSHRVYSAVAVVDEAQGVARCEVCISEVTMRKYSYEELFAYVASGDPLDKAGGYALQHPGFRPVKQVMGCYANVVGLPLCLLARMVAPLQTTPFDQLVLRCQERFDQPCQVYQAWLGAR